MGDAEGQKEVIDIQSQEKKEALEYFMLMAKKGAQAVKTKLKKYGPINQDSTC
ncbi:MAG: hypothetical protein ACFFCW_48385 [Candidatus Hodarchaeota archaeon]